MTLPNLTSQTDVALDPMQGTLQAFHGRTARQCQARGCDGCLVCACRSTDFLQVDQKSAGSAGAAPDSFARAPKVPECHPRPVYSIFGIDPGPEQSGWCVYLPDHHRVLSCGVKKNSDLLRYLEMVSHSRIAMEMIASYGMPVGREVFETCVWIGRFMQAMERPEAVDLVYRKDVKMHLCGTTKAKDGNVRQAILDLFPRTGGGATPQVGTKGQPGPLYGVSTHAWPALGVAITSNARSGRQPQERKA